MTSEEYIKTFRMDQPNFRFNRKAFMETFGTEFLNQVYAHKPNPKTGVFLIVSIHFSISSLAK